MLSVSCNKNNSNINTLLKKCLTKTVYRKHPVYNADFFVAFIDRQKHVQVVYKSVGRGLC